MLIKVLLGKLVSAIENFFGSCKMAYFESLIQGEGSFFGSHCILKNPENIYVGKGMSIL